MFRRDVVFAASILAWYVCVRLEVWALLRASDATFRHGARARRAPARVATRRVLCSGPWLLAPGSIADRWARTRWSASSTLIIGTQTEDIRNKCALRSFNSHAFTLFPCGINSSEISGETGTGAVKKQAATSRLVKNFGKAIHYHPYYLILWLIYLLF
jgi:hypothetical protein